MFNSNKPSKNVSTQQQSSPSVNIVSEGTKLKGNLHAQTDIRIGGLVDGEAVSKGKLIITEKGRVNGNVTSRDADIAGRVEGEVKVGNKLVLRQNAVVDGNIYTKTLIVEEGAQINGACRMGEDIKNLSQASDADFEKGTHLKAKASGS
jgi:cytoskeletal protein CcmA (bactofilin family)